MRSKKKSKKTTLRWFSARSAFVLRAHGTARNSDKYYRRASIMTEDRTILIQSVSAVTALREAKREAQQYSQRTYKNIYRQTVRIKFLGRIDLYEVGYLLRNGSELNSTCRLLPASLPRKKLLIKLFDDPKQHVTSMHGPERKFLPAMVVKAYENEDQRHLP